MHVLLSYFLKKVNTVCHSPRSESVAFVIGISYSVCMDVLMKLCLKKQEKDVLKSCKY